jgi:DNA-binding NarL/FixJ family response regulator
MKQGRIVVANKDPNTLGAIRRLLETVAETVLKVADETSLWDVLENAKPDVVVADLSLTFSKGTNCAGELKKKYPSIKVIILSLYGEKCVLDEVMATGVEGFVLKSRAGVDLISAIHEVLQGHKYISPDV